MMNFKIARVMGIPIRVNITLILFLPIVAWLISRPDGLIIWTDTINSMSPHDMDSDALIRSSWIVGALAAIGLFFGVTVHELGHSWVAQRYQINISSITLWIFGGMAHMENLPEEWNKEFWIAIAGPITSVALGAVFFGLLQVMPSVSVVAVFVVGWLALMNLVLAVFNMLPAFPMDGGRILRALLARNRPYVEATQIAASIGKGFAIAMAIFGIFYNIIMVLIAMFVYIAATSESRLTVVRDLLRDVKAMDLMTVDVISVSPNDSVRDLVNKMLMDRLTAYPVIENGEIQGVVSMADLQGLSDDERASLKVKDIMKSEYVLVTPDEDAFDVMMHLGKPNTDRVFVVDEDELLGVISNSDIFSALEVLEGLKTQSIKRVLPEGYP